MVGITGPPGSGKSTLVNALIAEWRRAGKRVGMLAVDPSSPYTGGAIMGDRIRMMEHAADRDVFMRSMASRGELGGLAGATWLAAAALDAAGYDPIVIETVGAGQSEVEIARLAETTVVVEVPEMGDEVQAIKAGLLEVADIIAVNKADRPGADRAARQLRAMLSTAGGRVTRKPPPILVTTATSGEGVAELVKAIESHRSEARSPEQARARARNQVRRALSDCGLAQRGSAARLGGDGGSGRRPRARSDHRRRAALGGRDMSKVRVHISTSLDGYVAGPNQSQEAPLGEGGERLHDWVIVLKAWREAVGLEGGEENVSNAVVERGESERRRRDHGSWQVRSGHPWPVGRRSMARLVG